MTQEQLVEEMKREARAYLHESGNDSFKLESVDKLITTTAQRVREERDKEYAEIFAWLLGEKGDFPNLAEKPHYTFRTELRQRLSTLNK